MIVTELCKLSKLTYYTHLFFFNAASSDIVSHNFFRVPLVDLLCSKDRHGAVTP